MNRAISRAMRLMELERLYLERAFSDSELAARFGVDRTIIHRDRRQLEESGLPFIEEGRGKYRLDRRKYLSNLRLNIREGLALYLASRRESQRIQVGLQPLANALDKLSYVLQKPMTDKLVRAAEQILLEKLPPKQDQIFETVAHAWVDNLRLRVRYQGLSTRKPYWDRISPYLIEPSPWSDSVYVIGPSASLRTIVTYRLDRIFEAFITTERFEIPDDFDEEAMLRYAWGVWRGEEEPKEVVLQFAPGPAAKRLQESRWHPLEQTTQLEDGGVIWRAPIAEWREMLPWIRGWGADVTVLAPAALRAALQSEAQRLAAIYLAGASQTPPWFWLWAKADAASGQWHPLLYHLIDVGMVARALWEEAMSSGLRARYAALLGLSEEDAGRYIAFLASSHDLGKASPAFQSKVDFLRPSLERQGFRFPPSLGEKGAPHGFITTWALKKQLIERLHLAKRDALDIAHVVGGHHGIWPKVSDVLDNHLMAFDKGDAFWTQARDALFQQLLDIFQPPTGVALPSETETRNALLIFLSGFTTTADWLGSMNTFFSYEERWMQPQAYADLARAAARRALSETGWIGWRPKETTPSFDALFPFAPNAIQRTLFDLSLNADLPALVILEAPTGGGKTEAALYLADAWLTRAQGQGLYVAMPTQATSNQMFGRTKRFLETRYPNEPLNLHLVHGNAAWSPQFQEIPIARIGEQPAESVTARAWFLPRKRTLLAPFGVGTVDQTFLGVLMARHFFLRLYGLGTKVLIFDEVHAYDAYMSEIFQRLLTWLRVMGASVIILSATLPEATRRALIAAYVGHDPDKLAIPASSYPRITLAHGEQVSAVSIPFSQSRTVQLAWLPPEMDALIESLNEALAEGGCAAVICNTVGRAQEVHQALKAANLVDPDQLILFHARMPFAWRKQIENRVLQAFGKPGQEGDKRPHRAIVVATQVIEQSLDLDFDFIITELAPIDLIIQRAGRLHRHPRGQRPPRLRQPRLAIIQPQGESTQPDFGPSRYIYQPYLLWQTWLTLTSYHALHLPDDTEDLIEAVYGPFQPEILPEALRLPLKQTHEKMERAFRHHVYEAAIRLMPEPTDRYLVTRQIIDLKEDDDPRVHEQVRAMTRLIGPTVTIVCLHRTPQGLFLEPDGSGPLIDLDAPPPPDAMRILLQYTVTIQHPDVVRRLREMSPWPAWKDAAALRYDIPIVFNEGVYTLNDGSYTLLLDRELGLRIEKEA